jgi:ABC-type lipoprotein release transport system permease subunit
MIKHYLKVSFRNLWKYKGQTLISVIGVAFGFACFAMATLWVRYEMTYDSFLRNADRTYCVYNKDGNRDGNSHPVAGYLKSIFPEIVNATAFNHWRYVTVNEMYIPARVYEIDSTYFDIFDVKAITGSTEFASITGSRKAAITRKKAQQLFGDENPIGKIFKGPYGNEYAVCAVVTELSEHSNYPFDILLAYDHTFWEFPGENHVIIELGDNVDVEAFKKKLFKHRIMEYDLDIDKMTIVPITDVYYKDPMIDRDVRFHHILLFSIAGLLLILCTLFNCFSLFVNRFRIRQKELALRIVFGASNRSLFTLLSIEFFMLLFVALLLGVVLINITSSFFVEISGVRMNMTSISLESLTYVCGIILISLLTFITVLALFRRRTLNASIHQKNRKLFRKVSIVVQLVISIGFIFCTTIILKQMYHLHNTDLGFKFDNSGSVYIWKKVELNALHDKIKQIPEITETISGYWPLIPEEATVMQIETDIIEWEERSENTSLIRTCIIEVSEQFLSFYGIKLVEGEMLSNTDSENNILINESAAKALGWNKSAGKSFKTPSGQYRVKGVIQNIYCKSPTLPVEAIVYRLRPTSEKGDYPYSILFKYRKGAWKSCKDKIAEIIQTLYPETEYPTYNFEICNSEHEYDKYLKSENTLLWILSLISLVCVIVCVFGFVSMVSLTCEERRKEIAVRKIHGATVKDILDIFFKEHLTLLSIGALIAFTTGYIIMKNWLAGYVIQTEISAWVYVTILLALIVTIILCVGGKVYKTSNENPVNAINR